LISVLENSGVEDFIAIAEMDDQDFEVQHLNSQEQFLIGEQTSSRFQHLSTDSFRQHQLMIPRKPAWSYSMSAQQIDHNEKQAFLKWRRDIALIESTNNYDLKVTPFEKNLEVWRQLWRVCERSDIIIQVVDARNPLLYYTEDLCRYLQELKPPRPMILLVNKADLLTDYQRHQWATYFNKVGIKFFFYSAFESQLEIDSNGVEPVMPGDVVMKKFASFIQSFDMRQLKSLGNRNLDKFAESKMTGKHKSEETNEEQQIVWGDNEYYGGEEDDNEEDDEEGDEEDEAENEDNEPEHESKEVNATQSPVEKATNNSAKVLTRSELLGILTLLGSFVQSDAVDAEGENKRRTCIGLVGFPNVGKSSVINTLLGASRANHGKVRVGVSSTPGKTKHFQTLVLSDEILLCDCPGLVFPSVMTSAGEMLCAGILPINHMRDHLEPASIIASRIPMHLLDAFYGMHIERVFDVIDSHDRPPTGEEMLAAFCKVKGYITNGTGRWDDFRGCKEVLRDFNDGHLLYVAIPPKLSNYSDDAEKNVQDTKWLLETESIMMRQARVAKRLVASQGVDSKLDGDRKREEDAGEDEEENDDNDEEDDEDEEEGEDDDIAQEEENTAVETPNNLPTNQVSSKSNQLEEEYEFITEEPEVEYVTTMNQTLDNSQKREHKKLKHWGKKNRKLRDKNPYGEVDEIKAFTVHITNRNVAGLDLIKKKKP
jgi:large subunit GTPase 1